MSQSPKEEVPNFWELDGDNLAEESTRVLGPTTLPVNLNELALLNGTFAVDFYQLSG